MGQGWDREPGGPKGAKKPDKSGQNRTKPRTSRELIDESSNSSFRVQLRPGWQRGNCKLSAPLVHANPGDHPMNVRTRLRALELQRRQEGLVACPHCRHAPAERATRRSDI